MKERKLNDIDRKFIKAIYGLETEVYEKGGLRKMQIDGITKKECADIEKYYKTFIPDVKNARGQVLETLVLVVHNPSKPHESGYAYIRVFGGRGSTLYDLGWHDHIMIDVVANIDALGKNIIRMMNFKKKLKVSERFVSWSSLMVGHYLDKGSEYTEVS
ncbi:MAG: hypothetical protein ACOC5T_07715 [Elusimicrobiota bacterium]